MFTTRAVSPLNIVTRIIGLQFKVADVAILVVVVQDTSEKDDKSKKVSNNREFENARSTSW